MQNRPVYYLPNLKVEFVRSNGNADFCANCTRLRITSDGKLKPCLMRNDNLVDVLKAMRNRVSDLEIIEMFKIANQRRAPYYKSPERNKV
jgi:cyclic pyranopterin phosphate synthase